MIKIDLKALRVITEAAIDNPDEDANMDTFTSTFNPFLVLQLIEKLENSVPMGKQ